MHQLLDHQAKVNSKKTAVIFNGKSYSYLWMNDFGKALASFFIEEKITRIAFVTANSPLNYLVYFAGSYAGIKTLAINPRLSNFELINILEQYRPGILCVEQKRVNNELEEFAYASGMKICEIAENPLQSDLFAVLKDYLARDREFSPDLNGTYIYHLTSGANGRAKFCEHTAGQVLVYGQNRADDMGYHLTDHLLISLSLNHAFAFSYQLLPAVALGLTVTILPGFSPEAVFNELNGSQITSMAMLPSMAYFLSLYAEKQTNFSHSIRYALVAGDALPLSFSDKFKSIFNVDLYQGIGMTEVYGYAQNTPEKNKPRSSGRAFDSTVIEIRDDNGIILNAGNIGNVYINNEATVTQYLFQPELTKDDIQKGYINTGDVGYLDEENYFYFLGRKKQIIIRGGSNISPIEVESVFYLHPEVLEVGVVGKNNPIYGQVVWAYVELMNRSQVTLEELGLHCSKYLAQYKLPEEIIVVNALPKNATGKIDRYQLQALANATAMTERQTVS